MTFWVFLNPEASRKNICKDHKLGKENIHSLNQVITFARKLTLTHRFFLCVNKKLEEVGGRLNSRLAYLRSLPYNSSGSHSKWSHTILFTHCLGLTWDVCDGSHGTPKGTGTLKIADRPTEHPTLTGTHTIVFPPNSPETARVEITLTVRNSALFSPLDQQSRSVSKGVPAKRLLPSIKQISNPHWLQSHKEPKGRLERPDGKGSRQIKVRDLK